MSRHPLPITGLLLLFVLICGGNAVHAKDGMSKELLPQGVDIFVPYKTRVQTKNDSEIEYWFSSTSLVGAGGVLVPLTEGHVRRSYLATVSGGSDTSLIVAGYINASEKWSSFVDEANNNKWKTYDIIRRGVQYDYFYRARYPTAVAKGNKVFVLVLFEEYSHKGKAWQMDNRSLNVIVGEVAQPKNGSQGEIIKWEAPRSLLDEITKASEEIDLNVFTSTGGAGVLMHDDTVVFPVVAWKEGSIEFFSTIIYSKNKSTTWVFPKGKSPADCTEPFITEWERGQLLMVTHCKSARRVLESRNMGVTWTEAVGGTLTSLQANFTSDPSQENLRVKSLITATIRKKKVMLYTQQGIPPSGEQKATALNLWVTDNHHTFRVGPVSIDTEVKHPSTLQYYNDTLYFMQVRGDLKGNLRTNVFLAPLTEELETIKSVLRNWAELDAFLSNSSVPTDGLVGFLSNASSGNMSWDGGYRRMNATVTKAETVTNGFGFKGTKPYAFWPVNTPVNDYVYGFVDRAFTLVATVTINGVPNASTPLLGAALEDENSTKFVGLSYNTHYQWETVFNGTATEQTSAWEEGKEYKVALMLQGGKGSVYVNSELVGNCDSLPTLETQRNKVSHFYFGDEKNFTNGSVKVRVTNVLLYNRTLSVDELMVIDGKKKPTNARSQPAEEKKKPSGGSSSHTSENKEPSGKNSSHTGEEEKKSSGKNSSHTNPEKKVPSGKNSSHTGEEEKKSSGKNSSHTGEEEKKSSGKNSSHTGEEEKKSSSASSSHKSQDICKGSSGENSSHACGVKKQDKRRDDDGSMRADVSLVFVLLLGLWGFVALQ